MCSQSLGIHGALRMVRSHVFLSTFQCCARGFLALTEKSDYRCARFHREPKNLEVGTMYCQTRVIGGNVEQCRYPLPGVRVCPTKHFAAKADRSASRATLSLHAPHDHWRQLFSIFPLKPVNDEGIPWRFGLMPMPVPR